MVTGPFRRDKAKEEYATQIAVRAAGVPGPRVLGLYLLHAGDNLTTYALVRAETKRVAATSRPLSPSCIPWMIHVAATVST